MECNGMESCNGMEWNVMEWNGMEWNHEITESWNTNYANN